ncbi:Flagellar basal body rod protein FlgB [Buchnera aphidicola (Thelaxes suberi)]|uniref:flagellar basal body rod protein FlgB n=1 Tax=Buchnera aphidicola TaxID=9 RepID=UPI0034649F8E
MSLFGIEKELNFLQQKLNLRSLQEELIASNIANVNTPGYKARRIDFKHELKKIINNNIKFNKPLNTIKPKKYCNLKNIHDLIKPDIYFSNQNKNQIGNTVNMDEERINFVKNSLKYQEEIAILNKKIKNIQLVLT